MPVIRYPLKIFIEREQVNKFIYIRNAWLWNFSIKTFNLLMILINNEHSNYITLKSIECYFFFNIMNQMNIPIILHSEVLWNQCKILFCLLSTISGFLWLQFFFFELNDLNKKQKYSCCYFSQPSHHFQALLLLLPIFCFNIYVQWQDENSSVKGGWSQTVKKLFNEIIIYSKNSSII